MSEFLDAFTKEMESANRAIERMFYIEPPERSDAARWYMTGSWGRFWRTIRGRKPSKALNLFPTIESIGPARRMPGGSFFGIRWDPRKARP